MAIVIVIFIVVIGFFFPFVNKKRKQTHELKQLMNTLDTSVLAYSLLRDRGGENPGIASAKADVVAEWATLDLFLTDYWDKSGAAKIRAVIRKFLYGKGITVSLPLKIKNPGIAGQGRRE